ncbi:MAG: glycosyltransferase [Candidatus Margulisbacteria bacterium]|nr:glycosyltransferase [Candidatus Margulisiibacteriota bacterium]
MKPRILYLYSDTGGGHRSAATAVMQAVEHLRKNTFSQEMVDVFASCSGFLNIFAKLYSPVIKYSPQMWGQLYYWLDDEKKLERLEKVAGPFILKELVGLIKKKSPNIIVSVHPMVNHLTVKAIKQSGKKLPFIIVITDPVTLHRAWITPGADQAIVATPEAKQLAVKYGMPENKIKVIGMPIDPKFSLKDKEKQAARKKDNLKPKAFTILMMGGGEGAGKMLEIIEEFDRAELNIQLIVIAGRNKSLETQLKHSASKFRFPVRVYGFTDQVHEIMAESDLIITKAGPGTIAEAMAMNLPIIITSWLPGQEEGNVEYVVRENVGRVSKDPKRVVEIVKEMIGTPEFEELKKNIRRASRPQAAMEIAREIFRYL